MWMVKRSWSSLSLCLAILLTCGWSARDANGQAMTNSHSTQPPQAVSIGGEPVVVLQRPSSGNKTEPQFLEATILPGRGMAVLQIKAYLPGKGEISLLNSPPLPESEQLLDKSDDAFGNQVFKMGGAILLPFANRIRGKVSPDGKTITADVAGKTVTLPANWSGNNPGRRKARDSRADATLEVRRCYPEEWSQRFKRCRRSACGQLRWALALRHGCPASRRLWRIMPSR